LSFVVSTNESYNNNIDKKKIMDNLYILLVLKNVQTNAIVIKQIATRFHYTN